MRWLVALMLVAVMAGPVGATVYYRDTVACANPTYSIANRNCTGSDGRSFSTIASARAVMVAGDTLQYRSGTYAEQLSNGSLNGTSTARITFENYPGESVTLAYTGASYPLLMQNSYITYRGLTINAVGATGRLSNPVSGTGHIIENMTITDNWGAALILSGVSNLTVRNNRLLKSGVAGNCVPGNSSLTYGIYLHHTSGSGGVVIENNEIADNTAAGVHVYPGPITNAVLRKNYIHDNAFCTSNQPGGVIVANDASGGNMTGLQVYDNVVVHNGRVHPTWGGTGSNAEGIRMGAGAGFTISNPIIANNTVYGTRRVSGLAHGIQMDLSITGAVIVNNLLYDNQDQDIVTNGGITTNSNNACIAVNACGTTNKITITNITDCVVSTTDFRLKTGTNPCRDAGTTTATRTAPVAGISDVGAYEQGRLASATVASGFIEVTMEVMTPGILPATGITGFTLANGTSTGTPVVSAASVKAGADNVIQLTVSGFTGTGTCTFAIGTTNMTDSGYVGTTTTGSLQGVNTTAAGQSVTGTCDNSAGGTPPSTPYLHYKLNEGTGNTLNDNTGNGWTGSTTGSPTWVTPVVESYGLSFPNDGVDRRAFINYGGSVNPTTQSFTVCGSYRAVGSVAGKIITGTSSGTNLRMYFGSYTGQTWQLGAQASSFSASGESEFPVTTNITRICIANDATSDIVTLVVDGVMGTSAAARKATTSYTLASNFMVGCGQLTLAYCGGVTVDEIKVWDRLLSPTELLEDYNSYVPAGGSVGGYAQVNSQQQGVYLTAGGATENRGSPGGTIKAVAGGGAAIVFQVDCTGSNCGAVALKLRYSRNGGTYDFFVPQTLGADGIAMWGENTSSGLNAGTVGDCISGALTENYGPTITDSLAVPTITMTQNHSYCIRYIVKVGSDQAGNTFDLRLYQDNGQPLAGVYAVTPRIEVITPQASAGP